MAWTFNPFTGNLDLTGSSGAVVFEGEVDTFADLPDAVGNPPVGSSYLVRTSTGVWLVNRKQAGIWIRRNNTGVRDTDWEYGGDYPVNSVNGQTGNVALTASDVGAAASSHTQAANTITGLAAIATSGSASDLTTGTVDIARIPSGVVTGVNATTTDVLSVSGNNLVADDGGTIDSSDPFIKWDDAAGKLVYANPLSRPSGAFYVGLAPTTTAVGTNSVNIQPARSSAGNVAAGTGCAAIGNNSRCGGNDSVALGGGANAASFSCVAVGASSNCSFEQGVAVGQNASTTGGQGTTIGQGSIANSRGAAIGVGASASTEGTALGASTSTSAANSVACGRNSSASLRAQFGSLAFNAVYWGGSTTDATANVELNLDAAATNRMTIAANTMAVADLWIAANSTGSNKAMFCRRTVAIRRDNANSTVLVGDVQTIGNDQFHNAPTWSVLIDADDTNEALRVRVTGAASETVTWRVTAFYRVV